VNPPIVLPSLLQGILEAATRALFKDTAPADFKISVKDRDVCLIAACRGRSPQPMPDCPKCAAQDLLDRAIRAAETRQTKGQPLRAPVVGAVRRGPGRVDERDIVHGGAR
jgi:hypothetical protein